MNRRHAVKLIQSAIALAVIGLVGASPVASAAGKETIGISMPTKSSARWISDGNNIVKILKEKGYNAEIQYAEDDVPNQLAQIENFMTKGVKVLVIAPIDGTTMTNALQKAADKGIKVIAYDRLIRNSKNVDYYVTFDNFQVGVMQANDIEKTLDLKSGKGPFNIELFAGSADDNNASFFLEGAMSILKPYMDKGKLVVRSKQVTMAKIATLRWDGAVAQARMDNLLSAHYTKDHVDAVLSPYDGMSLGIISSLKGLGYGSGSLKMPVVTGQDAEIASVKSIIHGEQHSTIFKDTRELAKITVNVVEALVAGKKPGTASTKSYNNGVKEVPSYLLKPVSVDVSNWKPILTGNGYYTESQLK